MTRKVYIGKPSEHVGKTAFQILANLKNFGIGRMLTRHEFDKFTEPSFHIVKQVETYMDPELKFGTLWCETVIRGKRLPGIRPLKVTYRPDFRLIPKDEEQQFLCGYTITNLGDSKNVLPKYYTVPPLMQEWLKLKQKRSTQSKKEEAAQLKNQPEHYQIPFIYQDQKDARKTDADLFWIANRLAEDGEQSTVDFDGKFHFNKEYSKHCDISTKSLK